jgi:glycosyltransferase involved in cell wall biosynthesis
LTRLTIVTEIIAPYRIPVFNALAQQREIDLHVIFLAETDRTQRQWRVYQDEIRFSYQVLPSWRRRFGRFHVLLNWGMQSALRRAAPQVVICGGYNYLASWIALRWARRRAVPILLWVESTAKDRRRGHVWAERLKTRFIRGCNAFIVPGKSSREYLRHYAVDDSRICIAPNAVDNEFFAHHAGQSRQGAANRRGATQIPSRFFLFVGRLVPEKGIFDLVEAYGKLTAELRKDWGLVFVGNGGWAADLKRRASSMDSGHVLVAGFAQREELANYYGLADVFVFPTHSDPWGLVVNEAMACGLPVITTDAAGCTSDLVRHGWNGLVVRAGDTAQLASAMTQLASCSSLRSEMAVRGRERIADYSPEACASGLARAAIAWRCAP